MKRILFNPFIMVIAGVLLLAGCVATQVNAVWKDPSYTTRPAKIMVIGVARNPLNRRIFEDEFVAQLKRHGTEAIASYTVVPDKKQDDQEAIAAKVRELGADSVLVTRLVSRKTVQTIVPGTIYYPPPYYGSWTDYYAYGYHYLYTPGYIAEDEYAVIETNLYSARDDKLVWATTSETSITDSNPDLIREYIGTMVRTMVEHGLLGR